MRFNVVPYDDDYDVINDATGVDIYRSNKRNKTFILPDSVKYISGDETLYFVPINTFKYVTNDIDTSLYDGDGVPFTEVKSINITFEDPTKAWIESINGTTGIVRQRYNMYDGLNKNSTIWVYNFPNTNLQIAPAFAEDIKAPAYVIDRLDSPTYRIPITANTINIPVPRLNQYNVTLVQSPYQTIIMNYNGTDHTESFKAKPNLPLVLKYSNVDKEMFAPSFDMEKWNGSGTYSFSDPTYNIDSSNKDVKITSNPQFRYETTYGLFNNLPETMSEADKNKVNKIFSYGLVRDARRTFVNNVNVKTIDSKDWNLNGVTNIGEMFNNCNALVNLDVSKWNTSTVTNMGEMFNRCYGLKTVDVSKWNTGKVTNMNGMFKDCKALTSIDTSKWDTSNVVDMGDMFYQSLIRTSNLTSIGSTTNWNTSNVTNMSGMFHYCDKLQSIDVSKWDTSKVTNMAHLFNDCEALTTLDVSKWNTSKVTSMYATFANCVRLKTIDVSKWDTSNVTDMTGMFNACNGTTNIDVSRWNTSKVTSMRWMFKTCVYLTSMDITNWDTSNVTNMEGMFDSCRDLKTITGVIDMKSCINYAKMFDACINLTNVKVKNLPTDINTFCNIARIDKSKVTVVS